jgi:hypothetical protein
MSIVDFGTRPVREGLRSETVTAAIIRSVDESGAEIAHSGGDDRRKTKAWFVLTVLDFLSFGSISIAL